MSKYDSYRGTNEVFDFVKKSKVKKWVEIWDSFKVLVLY